MLVLAMAPTSDAQVNITLFPNGSANEILSNRNAQTADILSSAAGIVVSGSLLADSPLTTTSLTLDYPGNITSSDAGLLAIPTADPIRIAGAPGVFANVAISTINFTSGTIEISLPRPAGNFDNTSSGSFRVVGVRIDATGLTAPVAVTASLGSTANNYLLSTSSATVITNLVSGIASMAIGAESGGISSGTATIFTNNVIGDGGATMLITEGHAQAWRTAAQSSTDGSGTTQGTNIILTCSNIPDGLNIPIKVDNSSDNTFTILPATLTDTANVATLTLTASSLTKTSTVQIDFGTGGDTAGTAMSIDAGKTVSAAAISCVADMAPQGAALSTVTATNNQPTVTGGYPRFSAAPTAAVTVINIVAASTNMLIPFIVSDGVAGGFDTGISVANTSLDPFGAATGGASAAAGTLTFDLYPRAADGIGTASSVTTGSSIRPGVGLSADGTLAAGGTWSGLLSEVLTAGSQSTVFTGYVFIRANFLLAHGTAFVTNFSTFTSASPVLVLNNTNTTARTGFESLGF